LIEEHDHVLACRHSAVEALDPLDLYVIDSLGLGRGAIAVEAKTAYVAALGDGREPAELEVVAISGVPSW
jgi:hypothetical protein